MSCGWTTCGSNRPDEVWRVTLYEGYDSLACEVEGWTFLADGHDQTMFGDIGAWEYDRAERRLSAWGADGSWYSAVRTGRC